MRYVAALVTLLIAGLSIGAVRAQTPLASGMIQYPPGWNLVAGFTGALGAPTVVSGAVGPLYTYQAGRAAYETVPKTTSLMDGRGYWAFFATTTSVSFPQPPPEHFSLTLTLPAGQFVMIGNPFATVAEVRGADTVYRYDPATGYRATTTLQVGQGAWVFSVAGGTVTLFEAGGALDRCHTSQLSPAYVTSQGAAGHIVDTLSLANSSFVPCSVFGFVGGQMLDAVGMPLPTNVVRNGGFFTTAPGPTEFVLDPGQAATFMVEWSDVFTGSEAICPSASSLEITPPNERDFVVLPVIGFSLAPCNAGTLNITPLRPPDFMGP